MTNKLEQDSQIDPNESEDRNPWTIIGELCQEAAEGDEKAVEVLETLESIQHTRAAMLQTAIDEANGQLAKLHMGFSASSDGE